MIQSLLPRILATFLFAAVALLLLAKAPEEVRAPVDHIGARIVAAMALMTDDAGSTTPKCHKTGNGGQYQPQGLLVAASGACRPSLAAGYGVPGDPTRSRGLSPTPELSPPKAISFA